MDGDTGAQNAPQSWLERYRGKLAAVSRHTIRYWVTAAIVLAVTIWAENDVIKYLRIDDLRYAVFQQLSEWTGGHVLEPKFARVVLIQDDDYWDGELQHRSPTKRDYIARLVTALDQADASIIALDFDLRLSRDDMAGRPGDYDEVDPDYRAETDALARAIAAAAARRKIVLAKAVNGEEAPYRLVPDAYQPYGLCASLVADGRWSNPGTAKFPLSPDARENINCGYIALPFNRIRLPLMIDAGDRRRVDSFALAVARAYDPDIAAKVAEGDYYGTYIPKRLMRSTTLSAHALLAGDHATRRAVAGKIVIVGSGWHQHAFGWYGDAGLVDLHPSPIGMIGGALMHDNFVEAILSGRIHSALPGWLLKTLEVLFGIGAAVLFFRYSGLGVQILTFGVLFVVLFVAQWLMMAAFYTYFDALVPLVGLALHSLGGRILEKKA